MIRQALIEALMDEYRARAFYSKMIHTFGDVQPFSNIVRAEETHITSLYLLFGKYGIPVPCDDWYGRLPAPRSFLEACKLGVAAEIKNIKMYDRLLTIATQPDVSNTFIYLRAASLYHHLPAFEKCVDILEKGRGQVIDITADVKNGGSTLSKVKNFLKFHDLEFWKGVVLGTSAVFLLRKL